MTRVTHIQLILIMAILGFLTGPRAIVALAKFSDQGQSDAASGTVITAQVIDTAPSPERVRARPLTDPYESLSLEARSIYVWDISEHRKLFGRDEYARLPLASVAKMMMAVVATELLPPDTKVSISAQDISEEGDSGLYANETWKLADLLNFTLVASSNDGASAIASVAGAAIAKNASSSNPFNNKKLFVERMNDKAKAVGLLSTYFLNESGLDVASLEAGAYGSARDMAMLFEYVLAKHPQLFTSTTYAKVDLVSDSKIVHRVSNTNVGVEHVTGILGSKTGYTDLAGGNLVVVFDVGVDHPVVIAVLGSSQSGRFTDVQKLIGATITSITGN
jgi:serine-type D-Ala-D-Ala carboxypeptidase (penicillin-binding protein 5/6)